jgi:hypothetical protein
MLFNTIEAVDRDRMIRWKAKPPFVRGCIEIDGVEVPLAELKREGGSAIIPAGKSAMVVRMEARVEELPDSLEKTGEYEAMFFKRIEAVNRDRVIMWKPPSPFVHGSIEIDGVDVPCQELSKKGGSAIVPSGKSVLVVRMEVRIEDLHSVVPALSSGHGRVWELS